MKNLLIILFLTATSFTVSAGEPVKTENTAATAETVSAVDFKGTIADVENYQPLQEAQVIISSSDNKVQQTVRTDESGSFAFTDLAPGTYTVQIARNGYESYTRNAVVIQDGKMLNLGFSLFRN